MNKLFEQVYRTFGRELHAYLFGRTGSKDMADDLLQDVYLRVWNRIDVLMAVPAPEQRYWLFSIAANRVVDYYRQTAVRKRTHAQLEHQMELSSSKIDDTERAVTKREQYRELEAAIQQLPEQWRTILLMCSVGGMSSTQVGEALGMPSGTIRYKLSQARRQLAHQLKLTDRSEALAQEGKDHR